MTHLPQAAAHARAKTASIIKALRDILPPPPNWELERQVLAQAGGPKPLAGWHTTHEPEERRFIVRGTVCGVDVTQPFVGGYSYVPSLTDAGEAAVRAAGRITGEGFTDIVLNGSRRWTGPYG